MSTTLPRTCNIIVSWQHTIDLRLTHTWLELKNNNKTTENQENCLNTGNLWGVLENIHTSPHPFKNSSLALHFPLKFWFLRPPTPLILQWPIWGGYIFSEPHVLLLLVLLSMLAHLKLTYVHVCFYPRRKTVWCRNAAHVRPAGRAEPSCVFTNRTTIAHLWWSCISHKNSSSGTIRNAQLTAEQQSFNFSMSTVRAAVEWVLGDISTYFALLDLKKNLKIGLSPVGKLYCISALF